MYNTVHTHRIKVVLLSQQWSDVLPKLPTAPWYIHMHYTGKLHLYPAHIYTQGIKKSILIVVWLSGLSACLSVVGTNIARSWHLSVWALLSVIIKSKISENLLRWASVQPTSIVNSMFFLLALVRSCKPPHLWLCPLQTMCFLLMHSYTTCLVEINRYNYIIL